MIDAAGAHQVTKISGRQADQTRENTDQFENLEFPPLLLPLSFLARLLSIGLQAVFPDPLAHAAGALELEAPGDPVLPYGGSLADRPGDRHLSPVGLRRFGDGALVGVHWDRS